MIRWKLNEMMAKHRFRNKDLAKFLDVTENSVSRLRVQEKMPRLSHDTFNGICEFLNCEPGDLLERVEE